MPPCSWSTIRRPTSGQLGRIHEQIAGLVAIPAASTRNSGVELEAVVQATEAAANTIMEAAEAIQDWIEGGAQDKAALKALSARVNSIFEACSFQDVTGQRIRRAIQNLQQVETMLQGMMPAARAVAPVRVQALPTRWATNPGRARPGPGRDRPTVERVSIATCVMDREFQSAMRYNVL